MLKKKKKSALLSDTVSWCLPLAKMMPRRRQRWSPGTERRRRGRSEDTGREEPRRVGLGRRGRGAHRPGGSQPPTGVRGAQGEAGRGRAQVIRPQGARGGARGAARASPGVYHGREVPRGGPGGAWPRVRSATPERPLRSGAGRKKLDGELRDAPRGPSSSPSESGMLSLRTSPGEEPGGSNPTERAAHRRGGVQVLPRRAGGESCGGAVGAHLRLGLLRPDRPPRKSVTRPAVPYLRLTLVFLRKN